MRKMFMKPLRMCAAYLLVLTGIATTAYAGVNVTVAVPEVESSLAGAAVALLVAGYLVVVSRFRRK